MATSRTLEAELIARLCHADDKVRRAAIRSLGGIEASVAVPALVKSLGDKCWEVRKAAVEALGDIGPAAQEAVPALVDALWDGPSVRDTVPKALGDIGPAAQATVPALVRALGDWSETLQVAAAKALGHIGPAAQEAVPALVKAIGDRRMAVREAAVEALGHIGPAAQEAVPALVKALWGPSVGQFISWEVAGEWEVAEALGHILGVQVVACEARLLRPP